MNNRADHRDTLLAEVFHDDWETGPASRFARAAAASARHRRLRRTLGAAAATTGLVAVLMFVALRRPVSQPAAPIHPMAGRGYEIISDDELLARLPGLPVLVLPQPNGGKKIVLLDQ
jgi:hypothetical protein